MIKLTGQSPTRSPDRQGGVSRFHALNQYQPAARYSCALSTVGR